MDFPTIHNKNVMIFYIQINCFEIKKKIKRLINLIVIIFSKLSAIESLEF